MATKPPTRSCLECLAPAVSLLHSITTPWWVSLPAPAATCLKRQVNESGNWELLVRNFGANPYSFFSAMIHRDISNFRWSRIGCSIVLENLIVLLNCDTVWVQMCHQHFFLRNMVLQEKINQRRDEHLSRVKGVATPPHAAKPVEHPNRSKVLLPAKSSDTFYTLPGQTLMSIVWLNSHCKIEIKNKWIGYLKVHPT